MIPITLVAQLLSKYLQAQPIINQIKFYVAIDTDTDTV